MLRINPAQQDRRDRDRIGILHEELAAKVRNDADAMQRAQDCHKNVLKQYVQPWPPRMGSPRRDWWRAVSPIWHRCRPTKVMKDAQKNRRVEMVVR